MKRRSRPSRKKPSRFERVRREAADLVKFIDAHGGQLGAFRSYRVRPPCISPTMPAPLPDGT